MTPRYEGRWRVLLNLHPDGPGGVHDDNYARSLGFRRALVPGEAVAEAITPAIVHRFGTRWLEGGWFTLKMISPTFVDEEVHEVGEWSPAEPDRMDVRLENRDGRVTCVGQAGIGLEPPWDAGADGTAPGADSVFPDLPLGHRYADLHFVHDAYEVAVCRDAGGNETPWMRGPSPWGPPVSPPVVLFATILHIRNYDAGAVSREPRTLSDLFATAQTARTDALTKGDPGDRGEGLIGLRAFSGMHVQFDAVLHRPMFQEQPYVMSAAVVDKGISGSGRTWYSTVQFEVRDAEGTLYAVGRNKTKLLIGD